MTTMIGRVGIVRRRQPERTAGVVDRDHVRMQPVVDALRDVGVAAEAVAFDEDSVDEIRNQILRLDGVLVWVDPVMGDRDRTVLNDLLRDVSSKGVWVSAHPDVIERMGTKEILAGTRGLAFGSDTYAYRTMDELRSQLPARLRGDGPRVLKKLRGNAGIGIWKVEWLSGSTRADATVGTQDAHPRGVNVETLPLAAFIEQFATYLADGGCLIDQPFQPRIADGMVRCYVVRDEVAGFASQEPDASQRASGHVFGLPSGKTMYAAIAPRFAALKQNLESTWLHDLLRVAGVEHGALPLLWDADFFYGPQANTYVLCEINMSSVMPFPETVPAKLAQAVHARIDARRSGARLGS